MAVLQGATDKTYISSIAFLDQRDILADVFDVTSEEATILDIMELTGKMSVTDQPAYSAFMNDYVFNSCVIDTGGVGDGGGVNDGSAAGEQLNLTFTTASQDNLPVYGELAMLQSKKIGRVVSVNTSTRKVGIVPVDAADTLGTPTQGETVIFWSDAADEGGSDPVGQRTRLKRTENQIQIFKTANSITDIQKVSTIEVKFGGKNYIMYKLQHDTLRKHRMKIAHALLMGEKKTGTDPVSGNKVYTTQGLRASIIGGDGTVYTTGGVSVALGGSAITQAKIREMMRKLDKVQAPKEYHYWVGGEQRADFDELFHGKLSGTGIPGVTSGGIVYNSFGSGDAKRKALDLGVDSLRIYGRTVHVKTIDAFDHPNVFGNSNFTFDKEGYLIPAGKIKTDEGGKSWDYLSVRYMSGDGTDLKYLESVTGKLAPGGATDDKSVLRFSYQSVMGLQAVGTRLFGIFTA